jgi:replicative DNA helicase
MDIKSIDQEVAKLDKELQTEEQKQRLFEIKKKYTGDDEVISAVEYFKQNKKDDVLFKAMTLLPTVDSLIEGFRPGTLNIISGITKEGKTTFCQTLTVNFTKQGFKCLWFSLDTPAIELLERFKEIPIFYLPKDTFADQKLEWLEQKIIEGLAKYDTRIIFIDNLEFLSIYEKNRENYANQLGQVIIKLKQIAIKWNVIIFLNHHIKQIEQGKTATWFDLKDSSGIAHHSDTVFMIYRHKIPVKGGWQEVPNTGVIDLQLQRRGGKKGKVKVIHSENMFYEKNKEEIETSQI